MLGILIKVFALSMLAACTTTHAPRLVLRGYITLAEGERRGALGAAVQWVSVPRAVPPPLDPVVPPWPNHLAGRVECIDTELCAWERGARFDARTVR